MKIPDDVFDTRCRYCIHGRPEGGNQDIPELRIFSNFYRKDLSCNIFGICGCDKIPGECSSFSPNRIFGICYTCSHNNSFHDGFCTRQEQPNKRQIFIGNRGLGGDSFLSSYWTEHVLSTCDAYRPSVYWIDIMRQQAAEGRIPRNFDPETMKAIGPVVKNETAEKWAEIDRQQAAAREAKQKAEEERRLAMDPNGGQLALFDIFEEGE